MERAGDRAGSRRQAPRTQRLPAQPIMTDFQDTGTQQGCAVCCSMGPRLCSASLRAARRPGHETFVQQQTQIRILAACFARALHHHVTLLVRGRREDRVPAGHPRSTVRRLRYKRLHSGIQVKPNIRPSLRSGFTAYAELSPGSDALLPPSPCKWLMCPPGRATHITARLDAQTPGVRTTRFYRTLAAPVVRATHSLTVARPAMPSRRCGLRPPRLIPRS